MKSKVYDLSKTLQKYSDVWVALEPKTLKIVATGKDTKVVLEIAKKRKISHPILTRVPENYGTYIL
ncbi:MAG: hypothetical protein A2W22_02280 [Candidatus Levybacteria bacterium RBG_16_35_11]|nr:MAG: hypothetical protein A2W22_02280 [Candidatus Levybacteria bacterium RBG_16_35_11]